MKGLGHHIHVSILPQIKWNELPDQRPTGQNFLKYVLFFLLAIPVWCRISWGRGEVRRLLLFVSCKVVWLFLTPWTAAHQASLSFTVSQSLLKLMSIESVMPSNHLILCLPFFCLQSFSASGSFPNELVLCLLFASDGHSIGVSNSALVLPMNIQGWFPLGLTGLISLLLKYTFSLASPSAQVLYPRSLLTSAPASRACSLILRAEKHRIFQMRGVVRTILYPTMIKEYHTELFLHCRCYNSLATSLASLLSFLVFPGSSP